MKSALIVVDVQYDFLPVWHDDARILIHDGLHGQGGTLAIPGGDAVIDPINQLLMLDGWDCICATQDYHPADHVSFRSNHEGEPEEVDVTWKGETQRQRLWPDHCVQGTHGCELSTDLRLERIQKVVQKGYNSHLDSYSGFIDSFGYESTGLDAYLKQKSIDTVYVVGLAEDFCVFHTALEAGRLGYKTIIVNGAIAGIAPLTDGREQELTSNGVSYDDFSDVLQSFKH